MANKIRFDVEANIAPVKQAANEIGEVFNKISLPANLQKSFNSTFQKLSQEIRNFEVQAERGFESLADSKKAQNSLDKILTYFSDLKLQARELSTVDLEKFFPKETVERLKKFNNLLKQTNALQNKDNSKAVEAQTKEYEKAAKKVKELEDKLKAAENAKKKFGEMKKTAAKEYEDLTTKINEAREAQEDLIKKGKSVGDARNVVQSSKPYKQLGDEIKKLQSEQTTLTNTQQSASKSIDKQSESVINLKEQLRIARASADEEAQALEREKIAAGATAADIQKLRNEIAQLTNTKVDTLPQTLVELKAHLNDLIAKEGDTSQFANIIGQINQKLEQGAQQGQQFNQVFNETVRGPVQNMVAMNSEMDQLKNRFQYFFSAINGIQLFKRAIRDAFDSVKELDAAMTEMAVVTDYTIGDIWGQIDQYTSEANKLGSTTTDVIKSMVLYTQQGLDMAQATQLSTETMKMARIAGLEGAEATDLMTAALRGFNMELNEASAQRVNDVYSNLAANAAANTHEIADAMTRTASIANAAGMEFETTAAFLTQMIETTRESAENLGTAMKTIVARFTEMKKAPTDIINVEGEEISVNKVEAALKSVGVELRNTTGEFRDLDDVFLELASKWDSLDVMSQRYVATMAAGSRQQSRFIAMMSNYQRTMELTGYATNSAGASQRQFEKTMESLESKLNRLHNAWEQFTTGITNAGIIKGAVDLLTNLLTTVNKITDALDPLNTGWAKTLTAILAFKAGSKLVNSAFKNIGTQLGTRQIGLDERRGAVDGAKYGKGFWEALRRLSDTQKNNAYIKQKKEEAVAAQEVLEKEEATLVKLQQQAAELDKIAAKKREQANAKAAQFGKSSSVAQYANNQAIDAENKALKANSDLKIKNKAVSDARADAEAKEAIATNVDTGAKEAQNKAENAGLLTKAKYYAMMLFGSKTTRENARQSLADAGSKFAQAGATGTATGAQWALNAAMMACPVGWILAAIAAIVAAITIFATVHETTEEKVQRLNKSVEQLGAQMNETQGTINDLTDSWDKLSGLKDDLDDLTIGTIEWKKKLVEVNQEVLNLLDKYPQLAQYVTQSATGEFEISKSGYDQFLESQLESLTRQQQAYSFSQALAADMQQKQYDETKSSKYGEYHSAVQRMTTEGIKRDNFFSTGIGSFATEYAKEQERLGKTLSEQEQILISSVSANKKSLKNFEEIKNSTSADIDKYAELSGLTQEQVKKKKEEGELDNDTIKTLIAANKYRKEYEENASKLIELSRKNKLNGLEGRAIAGVNTFTREDLFGKDVNKIFDKYIKDGIVNIGNNENDVKEILTSQFGFDSATLNQLLEAGASLDNIVQNLVNSQNSLEIVDKNIDKLENKERKALDDVIKRLESQAGDLSNGNLEKITTIFSDISNQGGDIEAFSEQLNNIISSLKSPEEIEKFLDSLTGVDFSSETKIRDFITGLDDLGISLNDTVQEELIDATNAARDFDMSNVADQLKSINFDLTTDLQDRIKENNKVFTDKEYKDYEEELKSYPELLEKFIQVGNERIYIDSLDKLLEALNKDDSLENATERLDKVRAEQKNKQEKYDAAVKELGYMPNYTESAIANARIIWGVNNDFDNEFLVDRNGNSLKDKIDLKTAKGKNDNYLNSLLYSYDESGNLIQAAGSEYAQYNGYALNTKKIREIIERAKKNKNFAAAIPSEFYTIIDSVLKKEENDNHFGQWSLQSGLQNVISDGDLEGFLDDAAKNSKWQSEIVTTNETFLKKWQEELGKNVLSDKTIDEWKKLTAKEISEKLQSLELSSDDAKTIQNELKTWEPQYIRSLLSAKDIVSFSPETEEGLKAQQEAIDALINKHEGYEQKLKEIQTQYSMTEESAKKYLAVQYEQTEVVDNIISTLSDYKDTLDSENLSFTKGTDDYGVAISKLVDKFKELFGNNITAEWVEKNLSTIQELSKGGKEADEAMKKLSETAEAMPTKINTQIIINGDATGEKVESVYDTLKENFDSINDIIEADSGDITSNITSIKEALSKLDDSKIDIQVKANTLQALADLIKLGMVKAIVGNNPQEFQTLYSLALSSGLHTSGISKVINVSHLGGVQTITFKTDNEAYATAVMGVTAPKLLKDEQTDIETPGQGSGNTTNSISKDKDTSNKNTTTKEDTWENDYDAQYNALKKIEALERKRTELEREQSRLTKRRFIDEQALMKNKQEQVKLLKQQAAINAELARSAESYLRGSGNGDVWYDTNTGTIQTNSNAAYYNEEQMEVFNKQLKMMEGYYDQMKSAKDNLADIYEQIEDLTEVVSELTDPTYNFDRIIEVLDNTLKNLEREITHLERTDSGATVQEFRRRYEQSAQTYVDKYNQDTNKKAIQEQQLNSLVNSDYSKYFTVDWATKQLTRTATYAGITDPEMQKSVDTIISQAQELCNGIIELDNDQKDIEDSLYDLKKNLADKALEFQEKVYEAVVHAREQAIENLKNIDTSINNAASELTSSIQKNIQKIRQDRQNQKTEEELQNMEARLSFLQTDTSNANQKNILDLQKQLSDKQESYTDSLIDQKISELQAQNDEAAKQRKRQIEVMEAQLEIDKENGVIWRAVDNAIKTGINMSGHIQKGTELYNILSSLDEVTKMNATQIANWMGDLNNLAAMFGANATANLNVESQMSDKVKNADSVFGENSAYIKSLRDRLEYMNNDGNFNDLMWYDQEGQKMVYKYSHYWASSDEEAKAYNNKVAQYRQLAQELANARAYYKMNKDRYMTAAFDRTYHYASGGLADYTGPAWLDGSKTSPELVLSPQDTENFLILKDVLANLINRGSSNNNNNGDNYFEIHIDVDKISGDYDVDQMVERVQQKIAEQSRYRNVNIINMMR